jgi:hypothetical protein
LPEFGDASSQSAIAEYLEEKAPKATVKATPAKAPAKAPAKTKAPAKAKVATTEGMDENIPF